MANVERHVSIEPCLRCGKGTMTVIGSAESCFFELATCHLLKCENGHCNSHAWLNLLDDPLREGGSYIWRARLKVSPSVPKELVSDFREALACFHAGAYHAAAVMARRTLKRTLLQKGAKCCRSIVDMIADVVRQGKIIPEIEPLCDDIRIFGKFGAHPKKDLDQSDAETALQFIDFIITWLYGEVKNC